MTTSDSMVSTVLIYEPHICASAKLDLQLCCYFNECKSECKCESYSAEVDKSLDPAAWDKQITYLFFIHIFPADKQVLI